MTRRLIVLEDNIQLAELMRKHLRDAGYVADIAHSIEDFRCMTINQAYGLYIVDLGLPDGDAIDLISQMRKTKDQTPILITSARSKIADRIAGLKTGADDYLVKPFHVDEMIARIGALLRRPPTIEPTWIRAGNLALDKDSGRIYGDGEYLIISPQERRMLAVLIERHDTLVPRRAMESAIYDLDTATTPNALDKLISRVRQRIGKRFNVCLKTIHGDGYILETSDPGTLG